MYEHLKAKREPKKNGPGTNHISRVLQDNGIIFQFTRICIDDFTSYHIRIRLNIAKLLTPGRKTSIYQLEDYTEIWKNFYLCMSQALPQESQELADLDKWKTRRIDFCVQLSLCDVKTYIKLFQRGNKPSRGNYIIPYKPKNNDTRHIRIDDELRKSHKPGSVYFLGGKYKTIPGKKKKKKISLGSMIINIYDKQREMQSEKNNGRYTADEIDQEQNILRFEIQCLSKQIDYLIKKYNLYEYIDGKKTKDKRLKNFLNPTIAKEIILSKYADICGKGNYYKKSTALELIQDDKTIRNKDILKDIVNLLNGTGGGRTIWKEYQRIKTKPTNHLLTPKQFKNGVKRLNDKGINPITLKADYYLDELPSLYDVIDGYFDNLNNTVVNDEIIDYIAEEEIEELFDDE